MPIPERFRMAVWLAAVVLTVAVISHALDQTHDLTLVMIVVGVCLLAVDWLVTPGKKK